MASADVAVGQYDGPPPSYYMHGRRDDNSHDDDDVVAAPSGSLNEAAPRSSSSTAASMTSRHNDDHHSGARATTPSVTSRHSRQRSSQRVPSRQSIAGCRNSDRPPGPAMLTDPETTTDDDDDGAAEMHSLAPSESAGSLSQDNASSDAHHAVNASVVNLPSAISETSHHQAQSVARQQLGRPFVSAGINTEGRSIAYTEGETTFVSTAGGISSGNSDVQPLLPSSSSRRGFLSSLLNRSASQSGRRVVQAPASPSHQAIRSASMNSNLSAAAGSARPSPVASPSAVPSHFPSSSSMASLHQHARHNSTPPSPCPTTGSSSALARPATSLGTASPVLRSGTNIGLGLVAAPPANDGVFSRPSALEESPSQSARMQNMPGSPSNRASRIFTDSAPMRASTSMASTVTSWLSPRQGSLMTASSSNSGMSTVSSVTSSPVIGTGVSTGNVGTSLFRSNTQNSTSQKTNDAKSKRAIPASLPAEPDAAALEKLGVELLQLTPGLPLSRHGQPLCGAVLDGKYLLIGTSAGLDFIPLNRAGNRSLKNGIFDRFNLSPSPASSPLPSANKEKEAKVRKPISLIKKTRFKQLVILDERSNVLLAVAGRNDHVRVYALDALRTLIQRKMREIDEKDRYVPPPPKTDKPSATVPMALKGKGRTQGPPPPLSLASRYPMTRDATPQTAPPPDYAFPASTSAPDLRSPIVESEEVTQDATVDMHRRRSSVLSMPTTPRYARTRRSSSHATITAGPSRSSASTSAARSTRTSPLPSPSHLVCESISRTVSRENALVSSSMRRGSATPTSRTSSSANLGRRQSAAAITPSTVTALATSAVLPSETTSPEGSLVIRRKGSSAFVPDGAVGAPTTSESRRRGSIGVLEYESAAAAAASTLALDATDEPVPPIPEVFRRTASSSSIHAAQDDATSTSASTRNRSDSTALSVRSRRSRLLPRSPIAQTEVTEESEGDEPAGDVAIEAAASASRAQRSANRMSFAEALHELPEPSAASSRAALPPTTPRSTARLQAKEARRPARDDFAEALASFIREEDSPRSPNTRTLQARSPIVQPDVDSETDGPSLIDIMRAGPPQPLPITINGSGSTTSDVSGSDDASHVHPTEQIDSATQQMINERRGPRKLSKSSTRRKSSATMRAAVLARSASTEDMPHDASQTLRSAQVVPSDSSAPTSPDISGIPTSQPAAAAAVNRRFSLMPRSPIVRSESQDVAEAASQEGTDPVRSMSLQDILATSAPPERSTSTQNRRSTMDVPSPRSGAPSQPTTPGRKRWSLLDGIRPTGPATSSNNVGHARQPSLPTQPAANSPTQRFISDTLETLGLAPSSPISRADPRSRTTSSTSARSREALTSKRRTDREADDEPRSRRNLEPHFQDIHTGETGEVDGTTVTLTHRRRPTAATQDRVSAAADALNGTNYGDGISAPLECVKLARTKGSRFIRASETKKRTYLAVLCGENGERIELFTGSKNVSLSLNRTFVLPETPRTIEFQIQGEDLLDLYLIYDSAVFALEPSTVRVREVAIYRNERRQARREQGRSTGEAISMAAAPASPAEAPADASDAPLAEGPARTHSRSPSSAASVVIEAAGSSPPIAAQESATSATVSTVQAGSDATEAVEAPVVPFTTFQQLDYLPTFPASVLSISYIIPPTYDAVLSASPATQQGAFATPASGQAAPNGFLQAPTNALRLDANDSAPLLSPVSLLSNPTARTAGPPGLFFVTKGDRTTNIVDGDGRSIMKQPVEWKAPEAYQDKLVTVLDVFTRMEVLVTDERRRVCVIAFGPASVRLLELGMAQNNVEIIPQEASKRRIKANTSLNIAMAGREGEDFYVRDVNYLAKFGEICFFSERIGNNVAVYALSAMGHIQSLRR